MPHVQTGLSTQLPGSKAITPLLEESRIGIATLVKKIEEKLALKKGEKVIVRGFRGFDKAVSASKTAFGTPALHITAEDRRGEFALTITPTTNLIEGYDTGSRGAALLRGREQLETLLIQSGGTFSQDQVQTMLYGISRQAVDKRVREGSLLAVPGPNGARRYPVCQFGTDGSLIKGLKEVQAALPVRGPWSAFLFLMQPQDGLGGRKPLDALRGGDLPLVIATAKGLGAQGS